MSRIASAAIVAGSWLWVVAPSFSPALQFAYRDASRFTAPLKRLVAREIAEGRLPAWNPYVALGEPLLGSVNAGVLDPLNALLWVLPFAWAFKAMHWACFALAGLGGWLWLRGRDASPPAAAAGAALFLACGPLTGVADTFAYLRSLAAVPLFLWLFDRALARGGAAPWAAAFAWWGVLVGGDPQSWLLAFGFAAVLRVPDALRREARAPALRRVVAIGGLGVVLALPVLLPGAFAFWESDRAAGSGFEHSEAAWSLTPLRLGELAIPHVQDPPDRDVHHFPVFRAIAGEERDAPWSASHYLGVVALVLAGVGSRSRGSGAAIFLVVATLWAALGPSLGASAVAAHIPVWRGFQYPEKLLPWTALAVAFLATRGIDALAAPGADGVRRRCSWGALALAGLAAVAAWRAPVHAWIDDAEAARVLAHNLARGLGQVALAASALSGWLIVARRRALRPVQVAVGLAVLAAADVGLGAGADHALRHERVMDASGPLARWLREHAGPARAHSPFLRPASSPRATPIEDRLEFLAKSLVPLWNVDERVASFGWYGGMSSARYRAYREAGRKGGAGLREVGTFAVRYFVVPGPLENLRAVGIDPSEVRVVASDPAHRLRLVEAEGRPFAYVAQEIERVGDPRAALEAVLSPDFARSGRVVIEAPAVAADRPASGCAPPPPPQTAYAPGWIRIEAESACAGWLVVNESLRAGWEATLDGSFVDPVHANFLVQAVAFPRGRHVLELRYEPPGFRGAVALVAAAVLGGVLVAGRQRRGGRARDASPPES